MEPEGSLPHSQAPVTCAYIEPYQSSPCPPIPILEDHFLKLSSHLRLGLTCGFFPSGFPAKILYARLLCPIHATCPDNRILYVITQ